MENQDDLPPSYEEVVQKAAQKQRNDGLITKSENECRQASICRQNTKPKLPMNSSCPSSPRRFVHHSTNETMNKKKKSICEESERKIVVGKPIPADLFANGNANDAFVDSSIDAEKSLRQVDDLSVYDARHLPDVTMHNLKSINRKAVVKLREQQKKIDWLKQERDELQTRLDSSEKDYMISQKVIRSIEKKRPTPSNAKSFVAKLPKVPPSKVSKSSITSVSETEFFEDLFQTWDKQALEIPPAANYSKFNSRRSSTESSSQLQQNALKREVFKLQNKVENLTNLMHKKKLDYDESIKKYSAHIRSLESQKSKISQSLREKEIELRLSRIRETQASRNQNSQFNRMLEDKAWQHFFPLSFEKPFSNDTKKKPKDCTSDVHKDLDELFSQEVLQCLGSMPPKIINEWKSNAMNTVNKLSYLHHGFKALAGVFHRTSSCSNIHALFDSITESAKLLTGASEAYFLLVDNSDKENSEFWTRLKLKDSQEVTTFRTPIPKFSGTIHNSYVINEYERTFSGKTSLPSSSSNPADLNPDDPTYADEKQFPQHFEGASSPPGLAGYVYRTGNCLHLPHGDITAHPYFRGGKDNSDHFYSNKVTSTILVPVYSPESSTPIAVLQVSGKLKNYSGLDLSLALEEGDSFVESDKMMLQGLANYCGGILKKATYYANIESNKNIEEALLMLARDIFNCLKLDVISALVMEKVKKMLDADRCTLFIVEDTPINDSNTKMLFSWHSDIEKSTDGSTSNLSTFKVPFGVGIAGTVAETCQAINIPDAYEDTRFNQIMDMKTSYRTKSILAMPVMSSRGKILAVIQMINKLGGSCFKDNDVEVLRSVSHLISLAIENSKIFDQTQKFSNSMNCKDIPETIQEMKYCAEEIIGVEMASIYIYDNSLNELYTYIRGEKRKVTMKSSTFKNSILEKALLTKATEVVNNIVKCEYFKSSVDTLGGKTPRQVLVAPLFKTSQNSAEKEILGLLHLVNKIGTNAYFAEGDIFITIVTSQASKIISNIMEKERLENLNDEISAVLEGCMPLYKELNETGLMNAVHNTCSYMFGIQRAHFYIWNNDKSKLWTSKVIKTGACYSSKKLHKRRLSVSKNEKLVIPVESGILGEVLSTGNIVCVDDWPLSNKLNGESKPAGEDVTAGFVDHSVIACPVWDAYNVSVVGVLVLVNTQGWQITPAKKHVLPYLCRQISNSFDVCKSISSNLQHCHQMQKLIESSSENAALIYTLSTIGLLRTYSYPLNLLSPSFAQYHNLCDVRSIILTIPMDENGNRHVAFLTTQSEVVLHKQHYGEWLGDGVFMFDQLKSDIQTCLTKKQAITVHNYTPTYLFMDDDNEKITNETSLENISIPNNIKKTVASVIWYYLTPTLGFNLQGLYNMFSSADIENEGMVSKWDFVALARAGGIDLEDQDMEILCNHFLNSETEKVMYRDMFRCLTPKLVRSTKFHYSIYPVLNPFTHVVENIQIIMNPIREQSIEASGLNC